MREVETQENVIGYDRIELSITVRTHRWLPGQWTWQVWFAYEGVSSGRGSDDWAKGIEGTKENAWHAAALAREEIWELVRR